MLGFKLRPLVIAVHALDRGDQKLVISSFPSVCSYPRERDARTRDSLCLGFLQASAESQGQTLCPFLFYASLSQPLLSFPFPSPFFSFPSFLSLFF